MEFNEKLQELRKQKNMTQEDLAASLYVSRTAVSKWESGRGYPNIDSLKTISKFFGITVDELLSGEELLSVAHEDGKQKENRIHDLVFGLLDISAALLLFLPFFGQKTGDLIQSVSLLALTDVEPYLRIFYFIFVSAIILSGILTLAFQNFEKSFRTENKRKISLILNAVGSLLFIVSLQPYAATFLFVFLAIKALLLIKWR